MDLTTPPRITPGALFFYGLGLIAFATSLLVPWYATTEIGDTYPETTTAGPFTFGLGSAGYASGAMLVAGLAAVTLATRGVARLVLGVTGLVTTAIPVASLYLVAQRIRAVQEATLRQVAGVDREDPPIINVGLQAGPILAVLAVFLLVAALVRFTWSHRPTIGYATASAAAVLLVLALPWAGREGIFADRVQIVDYWFPFFGVLGALGACAAVVALGSCAFTIALGRRAWWPPLPGLLAAVASMFATGLVDADSIAADDRFANASYVDETVNSGIPALCGFAGVVMFSCTLVVAIREYRAARRATPPTPQYLPQQW